MLINKHQMKIKIQKMAIAKSRKDKGPLPETMETARKIKKDSERMRNTGQLQATPSDMIF